MASEDIKIITCALEKYKGGRRGEDKECMEEAEDSGR